MHPLAVVTRSGRIESIHYGCFCITDSDGNIKYHLGEPNTKIFIRSSAKPFLAVALVESGAIEKYGITLDELAVICSSHSGQDYHRQAVHSILQKIGLDENSLHCGHSNPYNENMIKQLIREDKRPSPLFNCCSGKHTGMLALCKIYKYPLENYTDANHPVQKLLFETIKGLIGCNATDIVLGVDGCTVPCYMISLHQHSYLYALLASGYRAKSKFKNALGIISKSMRDHPRMVIGDGEFCTELMNSCGSKVIGKVGDEGVYCVSIPEMDLGISVKIFDGNERAVSPVVIHLLKQLGVLSTKELESLNDWAYPKIKDHKGIVIGNILPVVDLYSAIIPDLVTGQKIEF